MHWLELLQEPFKGVTTDGKYSRNSPAEIRHHTMIIYMNSYNKTQETSAQVYSHYKTKMSPFNKSWTQPTQ